MKDRLRRLPDGMSWREKTQNTKTAHRNSAVDPRFNYDIEVYALSHCNI